MIVPAIVLCGGASARMGTPKALLDMGGETFLARVVRVLRSSGTDDVVVVTGSHDAEIREGLGSWSPEAMPPRVVFNPDHARGQLTSLLAGLAVVDHPGVSAVLVTLVDHPLVRRETVVALLDAWRTTRAPVVRPRFGDRHGHPVVFDRAVFDELRQAPIDQGARAVVRACGSRVVDVPVDDPGVAADIDTPEDYASAQAQLSRDPR